VFVVQNGRVDSNSHRARFDIIADILTASGGGVRKTFLMYQCNLSFSQLKVYSRFLLNRGLMRLVGDGGSDPSLFEVTDKGREFLRAYKGLVALMT
jgi:predicted transcriptional regulator